MTNDGMASLLRSSMTRCADDSTGALRHFVIDGAQRRGHQRSVSLSDSEVIERRNERTC
jgi:hypothetical protein